MAEQIPERRGRGWSIASLAAAGAAVAIVSLITYSGRWPKGFLLIWLITRAPHRWSSRE